MIVAAGNTFLSLLWNPASRPTPNPDTGQPVLHCKSRIEVLIDERSKRDDVVLIPTPCLAELLCAVPDLEKAVNTISSSIAFKVAPFDARAAIDLAQAIRKAKNDGSKHSGSAAGWQKVKFDRQIAAIAKANGAEIFYTDDNNQTRFAEMLDMKVVHTWDLDLPTKYAQQDFLDEGHEQPED